MSLTGTVKWYQADKGYGFLSQDNKGEDVFVHCSSIKTSSTWASLKEGEKVQFDIEKDPVENKLSAKNVTGPGGKDPQGIPHGTVTKYQPEKGFGFISVEGRDEDLFFHSSDVVLEGKSEPEPGRKVAFVVKEDAQTGKPKASKVVVLDMKRPAIGQSSEPKRFREAPPVEVIITPEAVRQQVEYYFSDENLKYDRFFHEKISSDPEGWLDMGLIMGCSRIKRMNVTQQVVLEALKNSTVEVQKKEGSAVFLRRPANKALPELQERKPPELQTRVIIKEEPKRDRALKFLRKKQVKFEPHDGGVIFRICGINNKPARWIPTLVAAQVKTKLPECVEVYKVKEWRKYWIISVSPFEGDLKYLDGLPMVFGNDTVKTEVVWGDLFEECFMQLPKKIREKRKLNAKSNLHVKMEKMEKELREQELTKRAADAITIADQKFADINDLRSYLRRILTSRAKGERLIDTEYKVVHGLLGFHPRAKEKMVNLTSIKVDTSEKGGNECFWIVTEDKVEDFSYIKCLDALESSLKATPPPPPAGGAQEDLSALDLPAHRVEPLIPGLFALASITLVLIGLRKFCSFQRRVWELQGPLLHR